MTIEIEIPGWDNIEIENVVFDLNGTLSNKGVIKDSTFDLLKELSKIANLYLLTADTNNKAYQLKEKFSGIMEIIVLEGDKTSEEKGDFIKRLGGEKTAAIGNGFNDMKMLEYSKIGIGVLGNEGLYSKIIGSTDLLVKDIDDAIELFIHKNRIIASLRK